MVLASGSVFGLGMGEMTVQSRLNQPFKASIDLLSVRGSEMDSITVRLASKEDFASAGIDRAYVLRQLRFELAQKADGTPYIKVTSKKRLQEPFLDFLIELNWSNGHLLKEYTALLDPPIFAAPSRKVVPVVPPKTAAPAAEKDAPKVTAAEPMMQPAATTAPTTKAPATKAPAAAAADEELFPQFDIGMEDTAAPSDTKAAPSYTGDSYGPTQQGDTLWSIAERVRPDDSVSISQMMLALLNANPEAFSDKNVNALRKGHVLRIPEKETLLGTTAAEALMEVKTQHTRWDQAAPAAPRKSEPAAAKPKTTAEPKTAEPKKTTETKSVSKPDTPEVKLVTPSKTEKGESGTGDKALQARVESMQKDLLLAKESLSSAEGENTELKSRLAEVEEQVSSLQRMLTMKDDDLAKLQQQLDKLREEAKLAAATPAAKAEAKPDAAAAVKPDAAKPDAKPESKPEAKPEAAPVVADVKPKPVVKPAKPRPVRRPVPPPPPKASLIDDILSSPMLLGILVVVLLGLIGGGYVFWQRRRVGEMDFAESILHDSGPSTVEVEGSDTLLSSFAASSIATEATEGGETDPLSEADVFIAYKRYSQAEEMLNAALEAEPDRAELKLKLMEVYYATENKAKFEKLAAELHESLGDESSALWEKAELMGKELCPDSALFGAVEEVVDEETTTETAAADADDLGLDLDFDLPEDLMQAESLLSEVEEAAAAIETGETEEPEAEPSLDLDFDSLGAGTEEAAMTEPEPAPAAEADTDLDLDFDLGAELGAEPAEAPAEEAPAEVSSVDEVATKLDLARAYIDMGDPDGARNILQEVVSEGSDDQKQEAEDLIAKL